MTRKSKATPRTSKATPQITRFDKETCDALAPAVVEAVRDAVKRFGLTASDAGGKYSETEFTMRIAVRLVSPDGLPTGRYADAFRDWAKMYGFERDDLGKVVTLQKNAKHPDGFAFRILGFTVGGRTARVVCERLFDGAEWRWDRWPVLQALGRNGPNPDRGEA